MVKLYIICSANAQARAVQNLRKQRSETGKWMIYEVTTNVGEATGLPLLKYLKDTADYEKDGYQATVTGYKYTHIYSGNLLLKAK